MISDGPRMRAWTPSCGERRDMRNSERPTISISSVVALDNVPSVLVLISAAINQNYDAVRAADCTSRLRRLDHGDRRVCVRLGARSAARSCAICADRQRGPRRVAHQAGGAAVGLLESQAMSKGDRQDRRSSRSRRRTARVGWCGQRAAGGLRLPQQLVDLDLRCAGDSAAQLDRAGRPGHDV